jgi:hypothetical protein
VHFNNGILRTSDDGLVKLGLTGQITGAGATNYIEGNLGRRANTTTPVVLSYHMGIDGQYLPFTFEVSHTGGAENLYVGTISLEGVAKMSISEDLEYLAGNQRYSLSTSGSNTILNSKITLPFDPGSLGFGTEWLRVAASSPGGWANLGGLVNGNTVASVENIIVTTTFALAKAAEPHVVPDTLTLQNITIGEFTDTCFAAVEKIVVAGNGTTFAVAVNGSVNLVAGQRIFLFPHTAVASGGYLHARIDETGTYCNQPATLPSVHQQTNPVTETVPIRFCKTNLSFSLFPNPTSGIFTMKTENLTDGTDIVAEVCTLLGERIFTVNMSGSSTFTFDLSTCPAGVYLVRVISSSGSGYAKVVKR